MFVKAKCTVGDDIYDPAGGAAAAPVSEGQNGRFGVNPIYPNCAVFLLYDSARYIESEVSDILL